MRATGVVVFWAAIFGAAPAFAEANPATGTWKLNATKSTLGHPVPAFVRDGILQIGPEIIARPAGLVRGIRSPRSAGAAGSSVFQLDLSKDGRALILTQPATGLDLKLVFERE